MCVTMVIKYSTSYVQIALIVEITVCILSIKCNTCYWVECIYKAGKCADYFMINVVVHLTSNYTLEECIIVTYPIVNKVLNL